MRVRAKAVSVATATNWVFNFALAWAVPPGLANIGYKTYFIFGTFNFSAFIHIFFMFLEEIEEVLAQGHTFAAWKIKRDVGKKTLEEVKADAKVCSASFQCSYAVYLLTRSLVPLGTRRP